MCSGRGSPGGSRRPTAARADTAAALGHYGTEQLIGFARRLDPGLTSQDFADAGRRLDRMPDEAFAPFGLSPQDVAALRERFRAWPRA